MNRLFSMDNKFFTFMSKVADLMMLNLACLLCCIPIVTIGPAITALYTVTLKHVKNEESYIFRSFFKAFKENLKQGIITWLIFLVLFAVLIFDALFFPKMLSETPAKVAQIFFTCCLVIVYMVFTYTFPLIAKFYNSTKNTLKNAMLMAVRHFPYTIIMLIVNVMPFILMAMGGYVFLYAILFYFLLGFATAAYINSYFFANKIFVHYIPAEGEEKEETTAITKTDEEK